MVCHVTAGDYDLADRLRENLSERGKLRAEIRRAKKAGDMERAKYFQEIFDQLTRSKFDVTKDEGSYPRDLDADDWYVGGRRRRRRRGYGQIDESGDRM